MTEAWLANTPVRDFPDEHVAVFAQLCSHPFDGRSGFPARVFYCLEAMASSGKCHPQSKGLCLLFIACSASWQSLIKLWLQHERQNVVAAMHVRGQHGHTVFSAACSLYVRPERVSFKEDYKECASLLAAMPEWDPDQLAGENKKQAYWAKQAGIKVPKRH